MTDLPQARQRPWRRRLIVIGVVLAVAGALMLTVRPWHATNPAGARIAQPTDENIQTGLTLYPPGKRPTAPDVSGRTLDGERLTLQHLRGNILVVNVWGSWCAPCRKEAPDLARLARETHNHNVRFVGIDTRDTPTAARAFVRAFGIPYPSIDDQDGTVLLQFAGVIPVRAIPSTLVIDPDGRIAGRVIGRVTYGTLRGIIDDVRAE